MNESKQAFIRPNVLVRLIATLLRPFPTEVSIQTVDLRGGELRFQLVRTPAPSSSNTTLNGEEVDRI